MSTGISPKAFIAPLALLAINKSGIDLTEPGVVHTLRVAFAASAALTLIGWLLIRARIVAANQVSSQQRCTVKSKPPGATEEKVEEMSWMAYDLSELQKQISSLGMSLLITGGLHYWKGITQPLVFQVLMIPMGLLEHNLFSIHVMGKTMERPFPQPPNPFEALMNPPQEAAAEGADAAAAKPVEDKKAE